MPKQRILVVEDDAEWSGRLAGWFSSEGFEVETAENGHEALRKVRAGPPDLVILDLVLPKMDGLQVARLIRFDTRTQKVPILMLTILGEQGVRAKGAKAGADVFLAKPVEKEALLSSARQLLAGGAGKGQSEKG